MEKGFLLNNSVEFWPDKNLLRSLHTTPLEQTLNVPTTRCLQLMLENRRVVTQEEFYESAWQDSSSEASPNTLYQNISLVRRALKTMLNDDGELVITVTRKGFRLNDNIQIEEIFHYDEKPDDIIRKSELTLTEENSPKHTPEKQKNSGIPPSVTPKKTLIVSLFLVYLIAVISVSFYTLKYNFLPDNYFSSYQFHRKIGECKFYFNRESENYVSQLKLAYAPNLDCQEYPDNYVTFFNHISSASIISCNAHHDSIEKKRCFSWYIRLETER